MNDSVHFRRKVLREGEAEGLTLASVAEPFKVELATITRWQKEW